MNGLISEQFCTRLVLTLGHFLWQGAAIALAAALTAVLLRGRAERFRYAVFLFAFLAMPLAAALTASLVEVPTGLETDSTRAESSAVDTANQLDRSGGARRADALVRQAPSLPAPALADEGVRPTGLPIANSKLQTRNSSRCWSPRPRAKSPPRKRIHLAPR